MLDIETIGTKLNSPVMQVAAIAFNPMGAIGVPHPARGLGQAPLWVFNRYLDVSKQYRPIDQGALDWWQETNPDLYANIRQRGRAAGTTPESMLKALNLWLESLPSPPTKFWSKGTVFDYGILQHMALAAGVKPYWECEGRFRGIRCLRGLLDAYTMTGRTDPQEILGECDNWVMNHMKAHDALDDCIYQIKVVQECYRDKGFHDPVPS